jgi:hypothetical protein
MTTKAEREKAKEEEQAAEEEAVVIPVQEPEAVEPATVPPAGDEAQVNPATVDDGVEDVELGPPVLGQFVQILSGDYQGHFAAYLGNVELDDDGNPTVVQVRTRDADNMILDLPYDQVSSTTYSGGR